MILTENRSNRKRTFRETVLGDYHSPDGLLYSRRSCHAHSMHPFKWPLRFPRPRRQMHKRHHFFDVRWRFQCNHGHHHTRTTDEIALAPTAALINTRKAGPNWYIFCWHSRMSCKLYPYICKLRLFWRRDQQLTLIDGRDLY